MNEYCYVGTVKINQNPCKLMLIWKTIARSGGARSREAAVRGSRRILCPMLGQSRRGGAETSMILPPLKVEKTHQTF